MANSEISAGILYQKCSEVSVCHHCYICHLPDACFRNNMYSSPTESITSAAGGILNVLTV